MIVGKEGVKQENLAREMDSIIGKLHLEKVV